MRVAVVGAGISGLVSAYTLAKAGVNVVLYEKEDYLGGNVYANNTLPYDFDNLDHNLGITLLNPVIILLLYLLLFVTRHILHFIF
jgi:cyclopropane-fatty-acyl-phospholipid synthase